MTETGTGSPEDGAICWICRDADRLEPLVAPCRCRGSMRGVHASCIESWVSARAQQGMRPELQGGDHQQPQICCDLCGAPYQAEHQPAHLCDCLKAHLRTLMAELEREIGSLGVRRACLLLWANFWLVCVMLGCAVLVSGAVDKACQEKQWQCWIASLLYVIFFATLMCESAAIFVSFPWTDTPPSWLLRPFFLPTQGNEMLQAVVVMLWAHLWSVPAMSLLACAVLEYARAHAHTRSGHPVKFHVHNSWGLLCLLFGPALLPHGKQCLHALRSCSRQQLRETWEHWRQEIRCRCRCLWGSWDSALQLTHLALNPSLPWLQIILSFPFGMAWFTPADPTPRYVVMGAAAAVACPAAIFAWLRLLCKGPLHQDYLCPFEAGVRMHLAWFAALAFLLYSALSVYAQSTWLKSKQPDPVEANTTILVVWGTWLFLVASYAIYANGVVLLAYSQQWRRRHGTLRIGGEAIST